jgi:hypothetical protein
MRDRLERGVLAFDRLPGGLPDVDVVKDGPALPVGVQPREIADAGKERAPFEVASIEGPLGDPTGDPSISATDGRHVEVLVSVVGEEARQLPAQFTPRRQRLDIEEAELGKDVAGYELDLDRDALAPPSAGTEPAVMKPSSSAAAIRLGSGRNLDSVSPKHASRSLAK